MIFTNCPEHRLPDLLVASQFTLTFTATRWALELQRKFEKEQPVIILHKINFNLFHLLVRDFAPFSLSSWWRLKVDLQWLFSVGLNINLRRQGTISLGKCDPGLRQQCSGLFMDSMSELRCSFPQRVNVSECGCLGAAKTEVHYSCREMFRCLATGRPSSKSIVCCSLLLFLACLFLLRTF